MLTNIVTDRNCHCHFLPRSLVIKNLRFDFVASILLYSLPMSKPQENPVTLDDALLQLAHHTPSGVSSRISGFEGMRVS